MDLTNKLIGEHVYIRKYICGFDGFMYKAPSRDSIDLYIICDIETTYRKFGITLDLYNFEDNNKLSLVLTHAEFDELLFKQETIIYTEDINYKIEFLN